MSFLIPKIIKIAKKFNIEIIHTLSETVIKVEFPTYLNYKD